MRKAKSICLLIPQHYLHTLGHTGISIFYPASLMVNIQIGFLTSAPATLRSGEEVSAVVPPQAMHTKKRRQQGAITISFSVQVCG